MSKSTKRIKPAKGQLAEIALNSPIYKENLPFEYVHYPNHYGTFFMFSKTLDDQSVFCECNKMAIQNHFELRKFETANSWTDEKIAAPLSSHFFPNSISSVSQSRKLSDLMVYKPKLCHRCNFSTPALRYCHEMYGGNFKQYYGWYINQTSFRVGIRESDYINGFTPDEFIEKLKELKKKLNFKNNIAQKNEEFSKTTFNQLNLLDKEISKLRRLINKEIENITREEFGFRKIGEGNVSETILTKIIEKIFSDKTVLKHNRPNWLEGLELDIFLPETQLGIEYQGQQHFFPIRAWGGKKALKELQERDQKKRQLCKQQGIKLIEIDYTEPLQENYIKEKICA